MDLSVISLLYFGVIYARTLPLYITLLRRRLCLPQVRWLCIITTWPFSDCIDLFYRIPGHVPNSKLVPGSVSLQTCKYACLQSPNCVAIDTNLARNTCYVITDVTMLRKRQQVEGFFLYPLLFRCPRPGKHSYITRIHNYSLGQLSPTIIRLKRPAHRGDARKTWCRFYIFLGIINYPHTR